MAICHFRLHRAKRQPQFLRRVRVLVDWIEQRIDDATDQHNGNSD
jgi:hypothetical protein